MGDLVQLDAGLKIDDAWKIEKKLGEGAFGAVYRCREVKNLDNIYALKVEGKDEKIQLLKMEVLVLNALAQNGGRHFCKIVGKGCYRNFNYVVMTFVGMSLADLRMLAPTKKFSYGTAMSVGIQCLEALEDLHGIGYLHRDVKPGNYTIGRAALNELRKVYVLDFGMARKFIKDDGKTMRSPRDNAGFRGTVKYAPIACHDNKDQGRCGDAESWLYMTVELTRGNLPWRNFQDMRQVGSMKKAARTNPIVQKQLYGGCPTEYINVMKKIDEGDFFSEPDYTWIYKCLKDAMKKLTAPEFPYDWEAFLMNQYQNDQKNEKAGVKPKDDKKDKKKKEDDDEEKDEKPDKKKEKEKEKEEEEEDDKK